MLDSNSKVQKVIRPKVGKMYGAIAGVYGFHDERVAVAVYVR